MSKEGKAKKGSCGALIGKPSNGDVGERGCSKRAKFAMAVSPAPLFDMIWFNIHLFLLIC